MPILRVLLSATLLCALSGCATSTRVKNGALIGALSGAAVGAGGAWVISDPKLRGSGASMRHGDTELGVGESVAVGAAVGLVVGAVVGAMVGHQQDRGFERKPRTVEGGESTAAPGSSAALGPSPRL